MTDPNETNPSTAQVLNPSATGGELATENTDAANESQDQDNQVTDNAADGDQATEDQGGVMADTAPAPAPTKTPEPASLIEREKVLMQASDDKRKDYETKRDAVLKPAPTE